MFTERKVTPLRATSFDLRPEPPVLQGLGGLGVVEAVLVEAEPSATQEMVAATAVCANAATPHYSYGADAAVACGEASSAHLRITATGRDGGTHLIAQRPKAPVAV